MMTASNGTSWPRIWLGFLCGAAFVLPVAGFAEDCTAPQTNLQMQTCAEADFEKADKRLNIDYKAARKYMDSIDDNLPANLKGASDALLDAQRDWIKYRDAACFAEGFIVRGGREEPLIVTTCKTELTQERSKQLRDLAASE